MGADRDSTPKKEGYPVLERPNVELDVVIPKDPSEKNSSLCTKLFSNKEDYATNIDVGDICTPLYHREILEGIE